MDVPETSQLQAFVQIADAGSLSRAAADLGLPRATLARRLSRLEEQLGLRLIHRTTRRLKLTDAGEEFYHHARAIVAAVKDAAESVRRDLQRPSGLLRISVPPMSALGFRDILLAFMDKYPEVILEVSSSTRHEDLIAGNIDLAWRAGVHIDPGLHARKLLRADLVGVAAPNYLKSKGRPKSPDTLTQHDCLLGFARGERPATHWPLRDGTKVAVRAKLVSNEIALLVDAAHRGLGIALLPEPYVATALREGRLVPVLPEVLGTTTYVALVYPERRLLKPAVRAFVDFVVERIQTHPLWETHDYPSVH